MMLTRESYPNTGDRSSIASPEYRQHAGPAAGYAFAMPKKRATPVICTKQITKDGLENLPVRVAFAQNLKMLMAHARISAIALQAKIEWHSQGKLSLSDTTINEALHRKRGLSIDNVEKIADAFGVEPYAMLVPGFKAEQLMVLPKTAKELEVFVDVAIAQARLHQLAGEAATDGLRAKGGSTMRLVDSRVPKKRARAKHEKA